MTQGSLERQNRWEMTDRQIDRLDSQMTDIQRQNQQETTEKQRQRYKYIEIDLL